ncbi:hypothetical protein [Devosia naphthalenivorans]|uniref:hypothetical protein n=1 Tax=Devosia naphthalenivorans TaxID=2082392 RepID=UPI0013B05A9B|nr:hypothetical protein [Devosia naphthalenivorans]
MSAPDKKPASDKPSSKPTEAQPGQQEDDNIDDMGRPVNDPKGKPLEQPTK